MPDKFSAVIMILELMCAMMTALFGPIAPYFWAWWTEKHSNDSTASNNGSGNATNTAFRSLVEANLQNIRVNVEKVYGLLERKSQVVVDQEQDQQNQEEGDQHN